MNAIRVVVIVGVMTLLPGCEMDKNTPAKTPTKDAQAAAVTPTQPTMPFNPISGEKREFVGVLRSGLMAIGGETTGWQLESENDDTPMEVDISRIRSAAEKLQGCAVRIRGVIEARKYVERGEVRVIVAQSIERVVGG